MRVERERGEMREREEKERYLQSACSGLFLLSLTHATYSASLRDVAPAQQHTDIPSQEVMVVVVSFSLSLSLLSLCRSIGAQGAPKVKDFA